MKPARGARAPGATDREPTHLELGPTRRTRPRVGAKSVSGGVSVRTPRLARHVAMRRFWVARTPRKRDQLTNSIPSPDRASRGTASTPGSTDAIRASGERTARERCRARPIEGAAESAPTPRRGGARPFDSPRTVRHDRGVRFARETSRTAQSVGHVRHRRHPAGANR